MKTNLPMAINPSVNYDNNFHYIEMPNLGQHPFLDAFVIEANTQTISESIAIFLGIGYDECIGYIGENNFTRCQFPRDGFHGHYIHYKGITLAQLRTLIDIAKSKGTVKFIPTIAELILTKVLPLFNQAQLQTATEVSPVIELNPIDVNQPLMMSSLEIAKMCEKRHDHVMADIKTMLEQLEIQPPEFSGRYKAGNGQMQPCFNLDKEMSLTLVTGYNVKLRHKIIKRWQELESQLANVQPQIATTPQTTVVALPTSSNKVNASFLKLAVKQIDDMKLSNDSKQVLKAQLLHDHAGLPLDLMLPVTTEQKLSPSQIAERLNVSPQAIGRIISLLGFRGKDDYCEGRLSKAKNGSKEIVQYFYTEQAVQLIKQTLKEKQ